MGESNEKAAEVEGDEGVQHHVDSSADLDVGHGRTDAVTTAAHVVAGCAAAGHFVTDHAEARHTALVGVVTDHVAAYCHLDERCVAQWGCTLRNLAWKSAVDSCAAAVAVGVARFVTSCLAQELDL